MGGHVCRWYLWGSYMCKQEDNTGCQFLGNVHLKKKRGSLLPHRQDWPAPETKGLAWLGLLTHMSLCPVWDLILCPWVLGMELQSSDLHGHHFTESHLPRPEGFHLIWISLNLLSTAEIKWYRNDLCMHPGLSKEEEWWALQGGGSSDEDSPDLSLYQRTSRKRTERGAISARDGASCPGPPRHESVGIDEAQVWRAKDVSTEGILRPERTVTPSLLSHSDCICTLWALKDVRDLRRHDRQACRRSRATQHMLPVTENA